MTRESHGPMPPLSPVDIAARTAGSHWQEVDAYWRGAELAASCPDDDLDSIISLLDPAKLSDERATDSQSPASMLAEIQRIARRGWIDLPYESPAFYGLNKLVAWVLSAGYITTDYTPYFGIRHGADYERLDCAFDRLQCQYELSGTADQPPRCVRPAEVATALGRVLAVLGTPVGLPTKRTTLPSYLSECPIALQEAFAYTYLNNRAQYSEPDRPSCEERSPAFRRELGAFLVRIREDPMTVSGRIAPPVELLE